MNGLSNQRMHGAQTTPSQNEINEARHWLRRAVLVPIAVVSLLMLTISAAWYLHRLADQTAELREQSAHRLMLLSRLTLALRSAEGAQRGFLLTGLSRYLGPYTVARRAANDRLVDLRVMYASEPEALKQLTLLGHWQAMRLEELEDGLRINREMGAELSRTFLAGDDGRQYMELINTIASDLQRLEDKRGNELSELFARRQTATVRAGIAVYLAAALAGLAIFLYLRRAVRERARFAAQLEHQAFHDALTGLPNRRYFLDHFDRSIGRVGRKGQKLGILFIDLDGFKRVNDNLGHEAGDEVLRVAAARFASTVRQGDLVARLGGDEFAVLFDGNEEQDGLLLGKRLLDNLTAPLLPDHPDYEISASIGFALYPVDGIDAATILARADEAMYTAKRAGKRRVCRAVSETKAANGH